MEDHPRDVQFNNQTTALNIQRKVSTLSISNLECIFLALNAEISKKKQFGFACKTSGFFVLYWDYFQVLHNRKIVKIALNLFDHASLQSRMFTIPIIDLLYRVELNHVDPKMKKNVNELNKRMRKFKYFINRIYDANPEDHSNLLHEIAMSTYWLSIDQLYYILLKGSGDLEKGLSLFSNVTYQSGDIVFEINSRLNMGKQRNE